MLYSENELNKRLKAGCGLYYFYASDEALVHNAAQKALKFLNQDDPETTVLDGPTPAVEEIVLAAGTISFFGGRRLVLMPLVRPSTYSDKDLQELCDTLSDTENAIFVMTSVVEESYGKLRPGKREQKLISCCEKLGYCVQINKPTGAALQAMARDWAKEWRCLCAGGRKRPADPLRRRSVPFEKRGGKTGCAGKLRHYHAADGGRDWHRDAGRRYL